MYLELTPPPEVTYKTSPGSSQQMNVLGIVVFSATMGESCWASSRDPSPSGSRSGVRGRGSGTSNTCAAAVAGLLLGRMGERGAPLVNVCQCINECVMKIINAAVW